MRLGNALLLATIGALAWLPAGAHAAAPLVGQWMLDGSYEDGASDAAADSSGNALHLKAPAGSIHLGPPARFGTGATLPTNQTPMQVTSPLLAPAQLTLLAWIKQSGNPGTLRYIAGRGDDGLTCGGSSYALYSGYPGNPGLHFYVRSGPAGAASLTTAPADASVFNGQWHLIAGTYDGTAARLYVDGVLVGEPIPGNGAITYALGGGTSFYADGYPVGGCALFANADDWPGPIDDVRVYDRALSPSELARLAAATGPESPLLVTDASLIPAVPAPAAPVPGPGAGVQVQAVAPSAKQVAAEQMAAALSGLEGASKKPPKEALREALAAAQEQALGAMKSAAAASQVGVAQTANDVSAKEAKAVQADAKVQARLAAMKYGIEVQVPVGAPGQVVEVAVTLALEKKNAGKVKIQQITLPPAVGIAGPDGKSATVHIPVDGQATAAMTKKDVARAAMAVQAAKLDSVAELGELEQVRLQQISSQYNQSMTLVSAVLDKLSDTQNAIAQNLKGGVSKSEQKEQKELQAQASALDRQAKKLEQQRDAANQQATQTMNAAVTAMLAKLAAETAQTSGGATGAPATKIPMGTAALTGCTRCKLAAASSN